MISYLTHSVERCVKLVTEAASHICGSENRDKAIRSKLLARAINPKIQNKSQYKVKEKI